MAMNLDAVLRITTKVLGSEALTKLQQSVGGLEGAAVKARSAFGNVVSSATWQTAAVAAAGIGAALVSSARTAMDFEKAMSGVEAKMGASAVEMSQLNQLARDLGRSTQFSASEVASGLDFLAMAGFSVNEAMAAMPPLLALAAAGGADLASTADIVSDLLGAMNLEAAETGRVADVMATAANDANTSVMLMGETFKFVAPVAANAGMSLEEMAAAIAALGDAGIKGSMAGTALRAILLRLSDPPSEAAKALQKLGVSTIDAAGNFRPLESILREVDAAMTSANLGTGERLALQKALFGVEAATAGAILQTAAATDTLSEKTEQYSDVVGNAMKIADVMTDNAAGAFKRLGSAWEGLQLALMSGQNTGIQTLIDGLAALVNVITDVIGKVPGAGAVIVGLSAAFVGLVAAAPFIAAFISVVGSLAGALGGMGAAVAGVGATLAGFAGAVGPALAAVGSAFAGIGVAIKAFLVIAAGLISWPVVVAAALIAAAAAIWIFRDEIVAGLQAAMAAIGQWVQNLWAWGEPIRQFWIGLWDSVKVIAEGFFTWIAQALFDRLVQPWITVGTAIVAAATAMWERVKAPAAAFFAWWGRTLFQLFLEPLDRILRGLAGMFQQAFAAASGAAQAGFSSLVQAFNSGVIQPLQSAWSSFVAGLGQAWQALSSGFDSAVVQPIKAAWQGLQDWMASIVQGAASAVSAAFQSIAGGIVGAFQGIVGSVGRVINQIIGAIRKLVEGVNRVRAAVQLSPLAMPSYISIPEFAAGGFVKRRTLAVVGEGGEPEYIVPESKMRSAAANYLAGARGDAVLSAAPAVAMAAAPSSGGGFGGGGTQINIQTGPVMEFEGRRYVTVDDLQSAARQTATQIYATLRTPAGRRAIGVGA